MSNIKENKIYIFITLLIVTPLLAMIGNYAGLTNYLIWYIPNFIMFITGLKIIIINIKKVKIKEYKLLAIFMILSVISCLLAQNKYEAIFGSDYRLEGLITYIGYLGFFYCGTKLIEQEKNKKIMNTFIICATIISIISLLRIDLTFKLQDIPKDIPYYFYQGPFSHFNHFGYYLLIANICSTIMYAYNQKAINKIRYYICHIILLYTLVINDTFGVYLSYLLILIVLTIYQIKKKQKIKEIIILIITFITISAITYRTDFNIHIVKRNFEELFHDTKEIVNTENIEDIYEVGTSRGKLWSYGIKYIKKHPLIGYGFENVKYEYHKDDIIESRPHNLILEQSLNSGVISMLAYITLIILIIKSKLKNLRNIKLIHLLSLLVVIGYLTSSMLGNSTFYVSPYFYVFLGITAQNYFKESKNEL